MDKLPLKISGIVSEGKKYGRQLGFPTANLNKKIEELETGVYAGFVRIEDKYEKYIAGITIDFSKTIEAHLIDFDLNIYGKNIEVEITNFIRPYESFNSEKELISQIEKDLEKIKEILSL